MRKSEMFGQIVDKVCEVCEVSRDLLIGGSRLQAVVDARILAVQYLRRTGLSNDDISLLVLREKAGDNTIHPAVEILRKKSKGIQKEFLSYTERCLQSYAFCLMSEDIKKFCRETYSELYVYGMKELPTKR